MARLVAKSVLQREGNGSRSFYRPLVTRQHCVRQLGRSFLDKVFGGDATSLLVHFAREAKVGPDELQRLRQMLDESEADDQREPGDNA